MKEPYKVLIVDDEPPARDIIEVFVSRIPDFETISTCSNALDALEAIHRLKPNLVFLDIQMPEMTGMELVSLRLSERPEFVLTTAYSQYALQSYEFSVLDYLVKPIAFERFMQTIAKFKDKYNAGYPAQVLPPPSESENEGSVWIREDKKLIQVASEDILYIEGFKDYVKVYLREQMILTHLTIGKAEEVFRPPGFVRIHRSHIVRISAIRLIEGNNMQLVNGKELQIGPSYREVLRNSISSFK